MYRRYVDKTFLLSCSVDHVEKFKKYLKKQNKRIAFTCENEEKGLLSFLDIKMSRENNIFFTLVYWKPTFSAAFASFDIFAQMFYSLIDTLLHRGGKGS